MAQCSDTEVAAMPKYFARQNLIRDSLKKAGLHVTAVSLGVPFFYSNSRLDLHSPRQSVREETLEFVRKSIDFASHLDAGIIYACSMNRSSNGDRDKVLERLKTSVAECSDYANDAGLKFALEPFPTGVLPTIRDAMSFIEKTGSRNLGVLLDAGHVAISGENLGDAVALSWHRVTHVHLNNNDGVSDLHWPPQRGILGPGDFSELLAGLERQSYRGKVSVELTKPRPVVGVIMNSRKFVERLMGGLKHPASPGSRTSS